MIRFLRAAAEEAAGLLAAGLELSSSLGETAPEMLLCAVAEYPELKVFIELIVSLLFIRGRSLADSDDPPFAVGMA